MLEPRECGVRAVHEGEHAPVALVFGRERVGLTNDELQKCHYHVAIPANPDYSSLNLAMAVQIWRMKCAWLTSIANRRARRSWKRRRIRWWTTSSVSISTGADAAAHRLYSPVPSGPVMSRLRRLFTRARPEGQELNILRGMLTSIEKQDKHQGN